MKRYLLVLVTLVLVLCLTGCSEVETVPKENISQLNQLNTTTLGKTREIEGIEFITTYDTGDYDLSQWKVTDYKEININIQVANVPEGATVLIDHFHITMLLKSTNPQVNKCIQDYMDDSFSGTYKVINANSPYQNKFIIEGISQDLINSWALVTNSELTEKNLVQYGNVYANKMEVSYNILVKFVGEDYYHKISILDEYIININ